MIWYGSTKAKAYLLDGSPKSHGAKRQRTGESNGPSLMWRVPDMDHTIVRPSSPAVSTRDSSGNTSETIGRNPKPQPPGTSWDMATFKQRGWLGQSCYDDINRPNMAIPNWQLLPIIGESFNASFQARSKDIATKTLECGHALHALWHDVGNDSCADVNDLEKKEEKRDAGYLRFLWALCWWEHWPTTALEKKKTNALTKGPPLIVTKPILSGHIRTNDSCPKKRLAQPRSVRCRGHSGQHHLDIKTPRFRRARPLQRHPDPGSATVEHPDKPLHRSQRTHGSSLRCGKLDIGVSNMRLLIR